MSTKPKFKYSKDLQKALYVRSRSLSYEKAAKMFNIPKSTLIYKEKGKTPMERKMGPPPFLNPDEEKLLVEWLFHSADRGFPVTKTQLLDSVQLLAKELKRDNIYNFKDGRPGNT